MVEPLKSNLTQSERIFIRIAILQTILAVVGMITGLAALYAAMSQADANKKQLQAAIWPRLQVEWSFVGVPGEEQFELSVENTGIGPAEIRAIEASLDGKPAQNWFSLLREVLGRKDVAIAFESVAGKVIPSQQDKRLFLIEQKIMGAEAVAAVEKAYVREKRIKLTVCYCSVFGDCWITGSDDRRSRPNDACAAQSAGVEL